MTQQEYKTNWNCYLYKWTHISTGKIYLGSRTAKKAHPDDGYICSSTIVEPMIINSPDEWKREIIWTGPAMLIRNMESIFLKYFDAKNHDRFYNRANNDGKFTTANINISDKTREKLRKATAGENNPMYGKTHTRESIERANAKKRLKYKKENHPNYGKPLPETTKENISKALVGKPGTPHTEEFKEKLSERMTGENNPMFGYRATVEKREACSIRTRGENNPMFGKHMSDEAKQKQAITRNSDVIVNDIVYKNITTAAKELQLTPSFIRKRIDDANYPNYYLQLR